MSDTPTNPDPGVSRTDVVWTIDQWVQHVLGFDPRRAAQTSDPSLCCTGVISRLLVDGKIVSVEYVNGRYGLAYVRVSDQKQRTSTDAARSTRKRKHYRHEGQSEAQQIEALIRYYASTGRAFRIISDAAITGEMPNNKPDLVTKMLERKARRYRRNFERNLPNSSYDWTEQQRQAMREYLDARVHAILSGADMDDDTTGAGEDDGDAKAIRRRRGKSSNRVLYRQGYSTMLDLIEQDQVHTIATNEGSRVCRDPDLHIQVLEICRAHEVQLIGLQQGFLDVDVHQPVERAMAYMVSSIDAQRLDEVSAHCFRGLVHSLRAGVPNGPLNFWLRRDSESGIVEVVPDRVEIALGIVARSISGQGIGSIWADLKRAGTEINGKPISHSQIDSVLSTAAILGRQQFFGVEWQTLPAIASAEIYAEMQRARTARRDQIANQGDLHNPRRWAVHELTYIMKCWCAHSLRRRYQTMAGQRYDYWDCAARAEDRPHARISAERLEEFVFGLCRYHPRILSGYFDSSVDPVLQQRQAQAALLQRSLDQAEAAYASKQLATRADAEKEATRLNFAAGTRQFEAMIELLLAQRLEQETAELESLRRQIRTLNLDQLRDRQGAALRQSLGEMPTWDNLDTITRGRLLQAVFSKIIVQMSSGDGWLELYLAGSDVPLPQVPLRRGPSHSLYLPTVEDWIAGTFAIVTT